MRLLKAVTSRFSSGPGKPAVLGVQQRVHWPLWGVSCPLCSGNDGTVVPGTAIRVGELLGRVTWRFSSWPGRTGVRGTRRCV